MSWLQNDWTQYFCFRALHGHGIMVATKLKCPKFTDQTTH